MEVADLTSRGTDAGPRPQGPQRPTHNPPRNGWILPACRLEPTHPHRVGGHRHAATCHADPPGIPKQPPTRNGSGPWGRTRNPTLRGDEGYAKHPLQPPNQPGSPPGGEEGSTLKLPGGPVRDHPRLSDRKADVSERKTARARPKKATGPGQNKRKPTPPGAHS